MSSQSHHYPQHTVWERVSQTLPFHWFHLANHIEQGIRHHLSGASTLLDCGCGSMRVSKLIEERSSIQTFGTDVMNLGAAHPRFCVCAGERLAFPFNFKTVQEWECLFSGLGLQLVCSEPIVPNRARPSRHRLFLLEK
ncbi:MAG: hypothetical protein HYZ25_08285 [Chloroflexi bacterium]|nr:hypothetical protein [Chloroflexota bacterium]